jgi:hypothetical protein
MPLYDILNEFQKGGRHMAGGNESEEQEESQTKAPGNGR